MISYEQPLCQCWYSGFVLLHYLCVLNVWAELIESYLNNNDSTYEAIAIINIYFSTLCLYEEST